MIVARRGGSSHRECVSLGTHHRESPKPHIMFDSTTATRRLAGLPEPEPLHPDLAACIVRRPGRLPALEHPLIVQAPYIPPLASYVNGLYASLRGRAETTLANRSYTEWLDMHAREFQARVLLDNAARIDHGVWWELVATVFRRELPWFDRPGGVWRKVLACDKPLRQRFMTVPEAEAFAALPANIEVWRPAPVEDPDSAFSCYPDEVSARSLAAAARQQLERPAGSFVLLRGRLPRSRVIAVSLARGVTELLALSSSVTGEQASGTL
jgi:hypothetical protein